MIISRLSSYTLWFIFFLIVTESKPMTIRFDHEISDNDVTITMNDANDNCIGFLSYRKIPVTSWYVIHSLYVYPQFRRKGYGSALVKRTCKLLKNLKATRVYIKPGPFELNDDGLVFSKDLYQEKMRGLITFYKKLGFKPVNSVTSALAAVIYLFMQIDEDSQYLMTKTI